MVNITFRQRQSDGTLKRIEITGSIKSDMTKEEISLFLLDIEKTVNENFKLRMWTFETEHE
jgi:hypothetical protein